MRWASRWGRQAIFDSKVTGTEENWVRTSGKKEGSKKGEKRQGAITEQQKKTAKCSYQIKVDGGRGVSKKKRGKNEELGKGKKTEEGAYRRGRAEKTWGDTT